MEDTAYAAGDLGSVLIYPQNRKSFLRERNSPWQPIKSWGTWTATKAERDGKPAADVVGHRLFFSGDRFEIQSKDRKSLYSGTIRVDASAKPTAIDFEHAEVV